MRSQDGELSNNIQKFLAKKEEEEKRRKEEAEAKKQVYIFSLALRNIKGVIFKFNFPIYVVSYC